MATTTKTYNGIEFFETRNGGLCAYGKLPLSKDDAETALERALCEYVKDKPMFEYWAVRAKLESGEILEMAQRAILNNE